MQFLCEISKQKWHVVVIINRMWFQFVKFLFWIKCSTVGIQFGWRVLDYSSIILIPLR